MAIEAAVAARNLSALKAEREAADRIYSIAAARLASTDRDALVDQLELALYAGKLSAYAQGFAVIEAASREFSWNLPMATIARIWRAGCIIRSQFLDAIAAAYPESGRLSNLLVAPEFVARMKESVPSLRKTIADAASGGLPVPALSASLAYFDSYRRGRGTTNLIQAQRDFFGAHGFERIDQAGAHHGPWHGAA
jgi:6-phosphogluconate dehydrogenase